jgi:hypothetical protein
MTPPAPISAETPMTVTLPAGVWQLLRAGLEHIPVARAVTDQAIAALEGEYAKAVAAMAPDPDPPAPPAETKKAPRK